MPAQLGPEQLGKLLEIATGRSPMPRPVEDRPSDQKLVALVTALANEADSDLALDRVRWAMTDAFYAGSQWLGLNPQTRMPREIPPERNRPRITLNVFQSWIDIIVSRLLSAKPRLLINPGSSDDAVIGASRAAQRVIGEHEWRVQHMDAVMAEFVPGYVKHGDAALKVEYNPKGGRYLGKVEKPLRDEDGNRIQAVAPQFDPMTGMETMAPAFEEDGVTPVWESEKNAFGEPVMLDEWEGKVETWYISAKDISFEPAACRPQEAMWCRISTTRSPAQVFDRFGIEVDAKHSTREFDSWRFRRDIRPSRPLTTVDVDELWIKAGTYRYGQGANDSITLPRGFVIIVAGDRLLSAGENPYDHGEFPIAFERALVDEKRMRGLTPANAMRDVQVGINKTASSIGAIIDMMGDPQWIVPNTANIPEADKRNGPGVFKRYEPGANNAKPEIVHGESAPAGTFNFLTLLTDKFGSDISGQHEGGLAGGAPAGVEAGVALEAIVERDTTRLAQIAEGVGRLVARWGYLVARTIQQFQPEQRMITIMGEWNVPEVIQFGGVDIYDSFEFDVVPGSQLPQSKAAEFQKDLIMLDKQVMAPEDFASEHGGEKIKALDIPRRQSANAQKENLEVQQTGMISTPDFVIQNFDDAQIHWMEHMKLILDRDFMRKNPEAFMMLVQHMQVYHLPVLQAQQAAAMAQAEAQKPKPPGQNKPPSQAA